MIFSASSTTNDAPQQCCEHKTPWTAAQTAGKEFAMRCVSCRVKRMMSTFSARRSSMTVEAVVLFPIRGRTCRSFLSNQAMQREQSVMKLRNAGSPKTWPLSIQSTEIWVRVHMSCRAQQLPAGAIDGMPVLTNQSCGSRLPWWFVGVTLPPRSPFFATFSCVCGLCFVSFRVTSQTKYPTINHNTICGLYS